ncbi:MAG: agmatine deiminase family protein [Bacteroidales bacterium]|nr:agmatine deiminase family protein [Bacteroidales bacterium]
MKKLFIAFFLLTTWSIFAQTTNSAICPLTHQMSQEEQAHKNEIGKNRVITEPPTAPIINIAEFQPSQGVVIRYSFGIPMSLIAAMSQVVTVTTVVNSASAQNIVTNQYQNSGVNMNNIDFLIAPTDSYWTRDYGPWFIIDGNGEFGIVDFVYNRPRPNDDNFASQIAEHLDVNLFGMNMQHTGGNYMTDGYGTSASTTLTISENGSNPNDLQQMASDYLGINTYHFIEDPLGDYIEHIDCWGKFLAVDKVMIGQVAESDPRYQDYEDVANFFANTSTSWGNNYRVFRVYTPGGSYDQTTPYTNSLILNDHVFVPQTGNEWDDEAIASYQAAMPGYTIVPVQQDNYTPWENTDALHCRTHEVADLGMLLIRHYPIYGEQLAGSDFIINAEITPFSGQSLIADSVLVYYRINDGEWMSVPMAQQCGSAYHGVISNLPEGSKVDYYIFAKDQSGRREMHPYIGPYDPHTFTIKTNDCPIPENFSATPNANTIQLAWNAAEGVTIYSIYKNNVLVNTTSDTSWIDENPSFTIPNCYKLNANCPTGASNYTELICIEMIDSTCYTTTALTGALIENNSQVQLIWNKVDEAVSYTIYKNDVELMDQITDTTYQEAYQNQENCYTVMTVCDLGNSEMSNEYCSPIISFIDEWDNDFKIYPNPVCDQLTIESQENIDRLIISNMTGQIVYSAIDLPKTATISIAHLPKGIYLIRINNMHQSITRKVIFR